MRIIKQYCEWVMPPPPNALEILELCGRVSYKSEDRITTGSAEKFLKVILTKKHESVLEHVSASMRFVTNRGVLAELTRHRIASFTVESTRYVNYAKRGIVFVRPCDFDDFSADEAREWLRSVNASEEHYNRMLAAGSSPQRARDVLPHSLKTEIIMTCNLREWLYVLRLRTASDVHPQMVDLMKQALVMFREAVPVLFDNI